MFHCLFHMITCYFRPILAFFMCSDACCARLCRVVLLPSVLSSKLALPADIHDHVVVRSCHQNMTVISLCMVVILGGFVAVMLLFSAHAGGGSAVRCAESCWCGAGNLLWRLFIFAIALYDSLWSLYDFMWRYCIIVCRVALAACGALHCYGSSLLLLMNSLSIIAITSLCMSLNMSIVIQEPLPRLVLVCTFIWCGWNLRPGRFLELRAAECATRFLST